MTTPRKTTRAAVSRTKPTTAAKIEPKPITDADALDTFVEKVTDTVVQAAGSSLFQVMEAANAATNTIRFEAAGFPPVIPNVYLPKGAFKAGAPLHGAERVLVIVVPIPE